jgi:DNA-directed RNA polymerase I subunit RPA12
MIGVNSKVFCATCGNLLNFIYDRESILTCRLCLQPNDQVFRVNQDSTESTNKSTSKYNSSVTWKNKLYNEIDKFKINVGVGNKVIIVQDCPNKSCDSKEMLEYSMQLRSVDEGSTVFSECPKCGIKFTVNN